MHGSSRPWLGLASASECDSRLRRARPLVTAKLARSQGLACSLLSIFLVLHVCDQSMFIAVADREVGIIACF